jgi:predicted helicase
LGHNEVINTAKDLSIRLAELASSIKDRIKVALSIENDSGPLTILKNAFKSSLVNDLDNDSFADMYAQTIAYGLLSARISDPSKNTADDLASHMRISPFIKELLQSFLKVGGRRGRSGGLEIDFDELGVNEIVELLDSANMEAVVRDFGKRNPREDPVTHFYEQFLNEYDPCERMQRGVFYTPKPLVASMVSSLDKMLRSDFGLSDGLADIATWRDVSKKHGHIKIPTDVSPDQDFVQILDPATGTGTFLVEIIDLIYKTLVNKWKRQGCAVEKIDELWNQYVPRHLLPRIHAFELQMAPYAIAHLKVGLKLYETGYKFKSDERARIFLTDTLEPSRVISTSVKSDFPALFLEAEFVNKIKKNTKFTVLIGNPPFHLHKDLLPNILKKSGAGIGNPVKQTQLFSKLISELDDFNAKKDAKFFWDSAVFFLIWSISRGLDKNNTLSHPQIISLILPRTIIASKFSAPIRRLLVNSFSRISIIDLGGENRGAVQEFNIFGIQKAVSMLTFSNIALTEKNFTYTKVHAGNFNEFSDLLESFADDSDYRIARFTPDQSNNYIFAAGDSTIYENFVELRSVVKLTLNGIQLKRIWPIGLTKNTLEIRWKAFVNSSKNKRAELYVENNNQKISNVKLSNGKKVLSLTSSDTPPPIVRIGYRSFDYQWLLWDSALAYSFRGELYKKHSADQAYFVGNLTKPASGDLFLTFSDAVVETDFHAKRGAKDVIPLFVDSANKDINLSDQFITYFLETNGYQPVDFLFYSLAVCSSRTYSAKFSTDTERFGIRVPLECPKNLYAELVQMGKDVATLNTLGNTQYGDSAFEKLSPQMAQLVIKSKPLILSKKIDFNQAENKILSETWEIAKISDEVFNFRFSGYIPLRSTAGYWQTNRSKARSKLDNMFPEIISVSDLKNLLRSIHAIEGIIYIQPKINKKIDTLLKLQS